MFLTGRTDKRQLAPGLRSELLVGFEHREIDRTSRARASRST
jgi:hypothetical protein